MWPPFFDKNPKWPPERDMDIVTFFLWEITQKFFFLAKGFHILVTRKNYFYDPEGSQWVPEGLLAPFRTKMSYF